MDGRKLNQVFRKIKRDVPLDYAYSSVDKLGDCNSCVNASLCDIHGDDSKGIHVSYWRTGMNGQGAMKNTDKIYIVHDLTPAQGTKVLDILREYYIVENAEYDPYRTFEIMEAV